MFKKLFLTVVLVLCLALPAVAGCVLPMGTNVWHFVQGGVIPVTSSRDLEVTFHETQPTKEMLEGFTSQPTVPGDWTDAVVVTDLDGTNVLVHKDDVICD